MGRKAAGLGDVFKATEPKAADVDLPAEGPTRPTSVGLKESELEALDRVAAELELSRNAVMRWALRAFLKSYLAGALDLTPFIKTPKVRKTLEMP